MANWKELVRQFENGTLPQPEVSGLTPEEEEIKSKLDGFGVPTSLEEIAIQIWEMPLLKPKLFVRGRTGASYSVSECGYTLDHVIKANQPLYSSSGGEYGSTNYTLDGHKKVELHTSIDVFVTYNTFPRQPRIIHVTNTRDQISTPYTSSSNGSGAQMPFDQAQSTIVGFIQRSLIVFCNFPSPKPQNP